jgi:hypothetical protein
MSYGSSAMSSTAGAGLAFSVAALIAGTIAASYWYRASQKPLDVRPILERMKISVPDHPEGDRDFVAVIEKPGEESTKVLVAFAAAVKFGLERGSHLNSIAATWSAAAAILGGLSAIFGSLH